ncbi:MAG: Uma2 family endonuclease [Gemmataceae bacterium]|nr:Uma2 family endonuclease [Gemmataceae bacterium]
MATATATRTKVRQTFVLERERVRIPPWVQDLESFRRWVLSEAVPEKLRVCYLKGEVWIDMSKEQAFFHNQVKTEFTFTLVGVVKTGRLGRYFSDGMRLSNKEADLSAVPDGIFVSRANLESERVRLVAGRKRGHVELEGSPDMVLEVVSDSSVEKDTETLRDLYWRAGIREYWLVDARGERLIFEILRHTPRGYTRVRPQGGWLKSAVFGKAFRLTRQDDEQGNPEYTLEVR